METLKNMFIGGVYTEGSLDRDTGGPECNAYMSFEYRLTITLIIVK
jgi:hypothetical protein